jgi:hypothetical protein
MTLRLDCMKSAVLGYERARRSDDCKHNKYFCIESGVGKPSLALAMKEITCTYFYIRLMQLANAN